MKRSILGLLYLIKGMREAGINVDQPLERIGIHSDALDSSAIIHQTLEWDIFKNLAQDVEPTLGIKVGQHYALAGYGPLLMLLVAAYDVTDLLKQGVRFQKLTHLSGELDFEMDRDRIALVYRPIDLLSQLGQFRAQCEISGTYKFICDINRMIGLTFSALEVELPFPYPNSDQLLEEYKAHFGEKISFEHAQARFWFDADILERKNPSVDSLSFKTYEKKCEEELTRLAILEEAPSLIQRVKDYLEIQTRMFPTMAETASALHVPERTLRHQLQKHELSFKEIREEVIKRRALELIAIPKCSIEQIAEQLGYSEPAAFNHAFKRWFGQSPSQYRK